MITADQQESVVSVLTKILQAIDAYRGQLEIDPHDLGTTFDANIGRKSSLDDLLKRWRTDPVGTGLREGIRKVGTIIAPHVTMQELLDISDQASLRSQDAEWSRAVFNHMWDGVTTSDGRTRYG